MSGKAGKSPLMNTAKSPTTNTTKGPTTTTGKAPPPATATTAKAPPPATMTTAKAPPPATMTTAKAPPPTMETTEKASSTTARKGKAESDNPFDAMAFELKEVDVHKAEPTQAMGLFVKSRHKLNLLYVSRIADGSISDKAGAKQNDYILAVNGNRIETKAQMAEEVTRIRIGAIHLTLARRRQKPLNPRDLKPPGNAQRRPKYNYHLCRLDPMRRPTLGLQMECTNNEILITSVESDGLAFWSGMQARDRLVMVGTDEIRDLKECHAVLKRKEGKVFDILVERSEAAEQHCQGLERTSLELQKVHTDANTPTAGVPETPPAVSDMMSKQMDNIMKNIRAGGKRKTKQAKVKSQSKPKQPNP